ncbi:MAG TPA: DUF488 family protein [Pelomicrobium sp.]|nr:DUF488 family protein [Pelomicrobium sp.]
MSRPLQVRRIYEAPARGDGRRILVDRLWPRGLAKDKVKVDYWARDVAPSNELRRWYRHDRDKWDEFRRRYAAELDANGEAVAELERQIGSGAATLLFGAKETEYNNAVALKAYLEARRR